jgi:translation initiation factor 2D
MAGTQAVARIVSTSDVVESSEFTTVLEETERTSDTMADVGDDCDEILEAATVREATTDSTEVTSDVITTSRDAVDSLLYQCFLYALKTSARKAELPLLTSAFFRNHMVRCCPKGSVLDVKKSSYKKLSKFLASMQKQGFIEVKELTKGVESVVSINQDHLELRMFQIPDWPLSSADVEPSLSGNVEEKFSYSPPEVTDMFQVTAAVLPLLTGRRKGEALLAHEVRQHVTDYVRANNLQHPDNKSLVRLDATLCDAVVPRGDYVEVLRWDELIDRCLAKMSAVHRVTFTGCEPRIHRGHIEPISLDVQQRGANKKVTVIRNLETYGIDLEQFASTVQKGVACSTSVGPQTGKPKCLQVNVQGNQINYIGQLLHDKYQLPLKYISGLEKAPKAPKKKKT